MSPPARPSSPSSTALATALLAGLAVGCQSVPLGELLVRGGAASGVQAGAFAGDERVATLVESWPDLVAEAADAVELVTGLTFEGFAAEAVLVPLGDETRAYDLRTVVREGKRTPRLRVNLERLAAGVERPEPVLRRGLALALLELTVLRSGAALPPWFLEAAAAAAGGDLAQRIERLVRDDVLAERSVDARLDPADPARAEATGLAAVLLLLERGGPDLVRRFLVEVADGEPPGDVLRRLAKERDQPWPAARAAFTSRLDEVEQRPFRVLAAAERAYAETGRAGLLASLPTEPADAVADELAVLAARAAFAEGDAAAARAGLRALAPDAAARLRDPLEALTLWLRAEAAPGGDPVRAARLFERLALDYPRRGEADRLRAELRLPEDPARALAALRRRARGEGLAQLELEGVARLVDLLVADQRHGAAQRVLDALGERGEAPELTDLARRVAAAEREPSAEALAVARARVSAWQQTGGAAERADVVDGGQASGQVLAERLGAWRGGSRSAAVRLLGESAGAAAVALLAAAWEREPALLADDVEALAGSVRAPELEVWVRTRAAAALAAHDAERLFASVRMDLAAPWVQRNPEVPRDLRSGEFAVRRAALARAVEEGEAARAPGLVGRMLRDRSPLLRREAVRQATEAGFEALVRASLEDPSPLVRATAALGLARLASDPASCRALERALREDPSARVRAAAAAAAPAAAPRDAALAAALARALADEDPGVRQAAGEALRTLPPGLAGPALLAGLESEVARHDLRGHVLSALFALLEPLAGQAAGYYPGMPPDEVRRAAARVRARLRDDPPRER